LALINVKDTPVTVRGDDESPAVFLFVVQTLFYLLIVDNNIGMAFSKNNFFREKSKGGSMFKF